MDTQSTGAGIAPLGFAIGITVVLVGLIVSPLVIVPLGGAITLASGLVWGRANHSKTHPRTVARPTLPRTGTGEERYSRSRLLERATLGLGGLVALLVGLPAAGLAFLPSFLGQRRLPVDLGPTAAFPEGEFVVATFLSDPQAGEVSRRAAYVRNNGLLGDLPSFTIMSSRCTHVGCPISLYEQQTHHLLCPCHQSTFDLADGAKVIFGPAARPLPQLPLTVDSEGYLVAQSGFLEPVGPSFFERG
jgi:nitrite reductase/ring-hydroxylating ferredoxin subunit